MGILELVNEGILDLVNLVNEGPLLFVFINFFCLAISKIITKYPGAKFINLSIS